MAFVNMSGAFSSSTRTVASRHQGGAVVSTVSARTTLAEVDESGALRRREAAFRNWISRGTYVRSSMRIKHPSSLSHAFLASDDGAKFAPEKDRYHLFVAYACPWAHRTLMARALKGLEDVIDITVVHPIWQATKPETDDHVGWIFGNPNGEKLRNTAGLGGPFPASFPGNDPNPLFETRSVRDIYERAQDTDGKYSVPILWDKKHNTIVSNESSDIIRMLNSEFNEFAKNPDLDLYPEHLRDAIEVVNAWVYPNINNGVYRCGFATSQQAYDKAIDDLTIAFDRVDEILQKQRYIAGSQLTEADIRLFVTLVRFDEVYQVYFKTNTRCVATTPSILNYCREIYQMPGVSKTVNMEQIKAHYYCSHVDLNRWSIIPRGPDFVKLLEEPHNRDEM
jgi:putative glutathione S-transferase